MKIDVYGMASFLKNPLNLALLVLPVICFIMLHFALVKLGYDPLPGLPIVALVSCFFYAYHITNWVKNRKNSKKHK